MILVRNVFQLKFGTMKEALALWKEGEPILNATGHAPSRLLTDITGENYTLVLENTFASLMEFEKGHMSTARSESWREWYGKFTKLVESGRREIFTVVQ